MSAGEGEGEVKSTGRSGTSARAMETALYELYFVDEMFLRRMKRTISSDGCRVVVRGNVGESKGVFLLGPGKVQYSYSLISMQKPQRIFLASSKMQEKRNDPVVSREGKY